MNCPQCRHENAAGNRFCGMCGTRLHAAEAKPDPAAPTVTWLKGMEESRPMDAAGRAEAERAAREHEMAERARRAASRERELAIRAEVERAAIRERERQRAAAQAAQREQASHRAAVAVGGPSFLGLNQSDDSNQEERAEEYENGDIYGGQRSYSRALWLLVVLLIASGLLFLQYRYSHSLRASQPAEKPSAAEPGTANPVNPEARAEDETAKQNEAASAKPPDDQAGSTAKASGDQTAQTSPEDKAKLEKQADVNRQDEESSTGGTAAKPSSKAQANQKAATAQQSAEAQKEASSEETQSTAKPSAKGRVRNAEMAPEASDAPLQQADAYLRGRGVARNCDQGVGILRSAANRGNYKADIKLGALYATGNCVSLDRVQAYRFFSRALQAKPNNTWVEQNRSMLWAQMNEQERQLAMEHSF